MLKSLLLFALLGVLCHAVPLTHEQANERLDEAGIGLYSEGQCSSKSKTFCTSLDGIRSETINWLINLKNASPGCPFTVTGGTEVGQGRSGINSHSGGYKVDLRLNPCLDEFIQVGAANYQNPNFRFLGNSQLRYPGTKKFYAAPRYRARNGAYLLKESDHWDVLYPHNPLENWG